MPCAAASGHNSRRNVSNELVCGCAYDRCGCHGNSTASSVTRQSRSREKPDHVTVHDARRSGAPPRWLRIASIFSIESLRAAASNAVLFQGIM